MTLLSVTVAVFTVTALALTTLGALAWWRSRRARTGVLAAGFAWFALAGLAGSAGLFTENDPARLLTLHVALSSLGLLTIYVATVKR